MQMLWRSPRLAATRSDRPWLAFNSAFRTSSVISESRLEQVLLRSGNSTLEDSQEDGENLVISLKKDRRSFPKQYEVSFMFSAAHSNTYLTF